MLNFAFAGTTLRADPSGALWWPERSALLVADLHLEKGTSFARRGIPLPPFDTRTTLARLETLVERFKPELVVALGDSFHDAEASERLDPADASRLAAIVARQDWAWIAGNHDPRPDPALGGRIVDEVLALGPLTLRHEARRDGAPGEISGHFHPKACLRVRGRAVSARCVVADGRRIVMPAFGAYAGGLDVGDRAICRLFPDGFTAYLLGRTRVTAVPSIHFRVSAATEADLFEVGRDEVVR